MTSKWIFALATAALAVACNAAYPSVAKGADGEWTITMPGQAAGLVGRLEFEAPAKPKAGESRSVRITRWTYSQEAGASSAGTADGSGFADLVANVQPTKVVDRVRFWQARLAINARANGLTCKLVVAKDEEAPAAVAVLCGGSAMDSLDLILRTDERSEQVVGVRAVSNAGALAPMDGAVAAVVKEASHKGTKLQPSYVWEFLRLPTAVAFSTAEKRVAFTAGAALDVPVVAAAAAAAEPVTVEAPAPVAAAVPQEAEAKPEGDPATALVTLPPGKQLGAGLQIIEGNETHFNRTYHEKQVASLWWYMFAPLGVLILGNTLSLIYIIPTMNKNSKQKKKKDPPMEEIIPLLAPGSE